MFYTIESKAVDEVELDMSSSCHKCGSNKCLIKTTEVSISFLGLSTIQTQTKVICASCGKKILKSDWNSEILDLVAQKKKEFKPSFFKRYGTILILLALFIGLVSYVTIDTVKDHNKVMNNAQTNFAKCYDPQIQEEWYVNLQSGDFILCNKEYYDAAQVFRIRSINDEIVILDAFDQYISRSDFEDIDKFNTIELGIGEPHEFQIKKKYLMKGIIEEVSADRSGINNLNLRQIKKK